MVPARRLPRRRRLRAARARNGAAPALACGARSGAAGAARARGAAHPAAQAAGAREATAQPREGDASHDADLPKLRTLVDELIIARRIATVTDVALGPITTGKEARDGGVAER